MKSKEKILNLIGVITSGAYLIYILFLAYNWQSSATTLFNFPWAVSIYLSFYKRISIFAFGLISLLTIFIYEAEVLTTFVHNFLIENHLYPEFARRGEIINTEWPLVGIYTISLMALMFVLIIGERTSDRFFTFIGSFATFILFYFVHQLVPVTYNNYEIDSSTARLEQAISTVRDLKEAELICKINSYKCFHDISEAKLGPLIGSEDEKRIILKHFHHLKGTSLKKILYRASFHYEDNFVQQVHGIVKLENSNSYFLMIEEKLLNKMQLINEDNFGKLTTAACLVWGWLFILLGIFHRNPGRLKLFSKK